MRERLIIGGISLLLPHLAFGYDAMRSWPSGDVRFTVALEGGPNKVTRPSGGLSDGSANWDTVAADAAAAWNVPANRIEILTTSSTSAPAQGNNRNDIGFSDDAFGEPFGDRTLAVTFSNVGGIGNPIRMVEADILVNRKQSWDSYRGRQRAGVFDLRRILIHEMGHAIGLDHPDEAAPPQQVDAVMNSVAGDRDSLAPDDIAGATLLYGVPLSPPAIAIQPASSFVEETGTTQLSVGLTGGTPPSSPTLAYNWFFTPPGGSEEWLFGQPEATIALGAAQRYDAGVYRVAVENPDGVAISNSATVSINPVSSSQDLRLYNLSTRGLAGRDNNSLVVGFAVRSTSTRRVLVRAISQGLVPFGVQNAATDVSFTLRRIDSGHADGVVASNNDWSASAQKDSLAQAFRDAGAFPLENAPKDAAVVVELTQGNYTATVELAGGADPGVAMVEIYDLSSQQDRQNRLYNLSTRGFVNTGSELLIGGLAVRGTGARNYLIRAGGDTLQTFGVTSTLDDPTIRVFDEAGNLLRYSDDWDSPEFLQESLRSTFQSAGAFMFTDRQETALRLKLKPGNYTLQVAGLNKGTGNAILEIYELD
ncbi:MAG: matrixin family metalloprotease [Opitutaceae bacterium]|nr:matrixin family metalloprotease [Opitutaceae bacterium]